MGQPLFVAAFGLALVVGLAVPAAAGEPVEGENRAPEFPRDEIDAWRDYLAAADDEDAWRRIPWSTTLADGVERASAAEKPLLLWVMNGHPLGCT